MKILFVIFFLCSTFIIAQVDTTLTTDKLIQDILEDASIDLEEDYLYDQLEELQDNPININTTDLNTLLSIPILDLGTAQLILEQRETHGEFYSTNEIKLINGIDRNIAEALQLFTTVESYEPETFIDFSDYSLELRSRFVQDLQQRRGFKEGRYQGEEYKSYQRLKFRSTNLNAAVLAEKDSGEKDFNDFTSFSVSLNDFEFIDKLTLGDYLIEFGQGLIYWGPYSFGKGAEAVRTITRSARTIRDYTSTDENQFFRGGATKLNFGDFNFTAHYSNHNIDGNVDTSTGEITSLPLSGLHRTDTEIQRRKNVNEQTIGGIISGELFSGFELGAAFQNISYNYPLEKDDLFDPYGDNFNFYSTSYSWLYNNVLVQGEVAYNEVSVANIHSITWLLSRNLSFVTAVRSYPRNFYTFRGTGFGESSTTSNEFGIYSGIRWRSDFGIFNFYYDQFRFPHESFNSIFPSDGDEFLLDYQVRPYSRTLLNIRLKRENKEVSENVDGNRVSLNEIKTNIRVNYDYYVTRNIRLRSRIEYVFFDQTITDHHEEGYLILQDFRYDPSEALRFYGRVVLFETESFDSRIYQFENDVRGVLFNPALFGKGMRWYFIAEYNFLNYFKISAKYSELYKPEETSLSSGFNEIPNNIDNRVTLQLDIKL